MLKEISPEMFQPFKILIRQSEIGIDLMKAKLTAFAVSSYIVGVAGAQDVAGELQPRELVVGQIVIERVDDPIPIVPHLARPILFVPVGVRIPGRIQPEPGPAFPKMG